MEMTLSLLQGGPQSRVRVEDKSQVGECRRIAQRLAESQDFDATQVGRVGIVATELANNVLTHAGRGELLVQALHHGNDVSIELVAIDRGPGMEVETCMRDGHSTAGTAGTGLGAVSRLSTLFDVYSLIDQGTVAVARISRQNHAGGEPAQRRGTAADFGAICLPLEGELDCGDTWRIAVSEGSMAVLVADGLGHGWLASAASLAAAESFSENPFERPSEAMQHLHAKLAGGRGAAAAVAILDHGSAKVTYAGVGNIAGSVVSAERSKGMVSHNGILGAQLLRKQQFEYEFLEGSRVVMHSDGMSARWSMADYPGLFARHASVVAAVLYRDHARARDDITVVVAGGCP
ncbi:MAG: ATP-binding protein [Steroidobacteraceae bacterium]